jgi:serine/threonine protein kinase/Tol biopolymer transport system component
MNTDRWQILSDWHNAWLIAPAAEREALRASFAAVHPQLLQAADELTAASSTDDFLETPALALAAAELAADDPILTTGATVGPYRVVALLARGGMGDVYHAHDPRLRRDVALKTLTPTASVDGKAVERFLQEARVTASLDHPHVLRVFDVGMTDGRRPYLVSELLDGDTLRAVIDRGPVPAKDVRAISAALASGLAAAHARGLVHRDLKPDNVIVTKSGTAKILDFGIAKLAHDPALPSGVATLTGVILGTAGYLAPEQITGDAVDARADLFALGSILFELLTGQRAFARAHTIDTLHAIVHDEPPDMLPPASAWTAIVKRLLAKSPAERFQSAADLLWVLEHPEAPDATVLPTPVEPAHWPRGGRRKWTLVGAVVAGALLALSLNSGWWASRNEADLPEDVKRFTWSLPEGAELDSAPVVSPDGRRIVFTAQSGGVAHLFERRLDSLDATVIAGTRGAKQPFWSPDGGSIGFFARGKLMKVALGGGVPVALADALDGRGGAWSSRGTIVFAPDMLFSGLFQVPADGGHVTAVSLLDLEQGENSHRWPAFLPDGVHVLFLVRATNDQRRGVYVARIDRAAVKPGTPLFHSESEAVFVHTADRERGVLLTASDGHVQARLFNAATLTVAGDPRSLHVPAGANTPHHTGMLSASSELLATVGSPIPFGVRLKSISRQGNEQVLSPHRQQGALRLSKDGRRLARSILDPVSGDTDVWIEDLTDGSLVRGTIASSLDVLPVWSPDGGRIAYASGTPTVRRLSIAAADGTGVLKELACPAAYCEPTDWSPDGRYLIVNTRASMSARPENVWRVSVESDDTSEVLSTTFAEYDARLSPDGQWLAYVSDESGRMEVSVRAMSGPPRRIVASSGGGSQPVWRRDGGELLYVDIGGRLQARAVRHHPSGDLALGAAAPVASLVIGLGHWGPAYDLSSDGQRIYFIDRTPLPKPATMNLLLSWQTLLKPR